MPLRLAALLVLFLPTALAQVQHRLPLPAPGVPDGLGVNIHFTDAKPGEMEMMAAAGFKWVRMDLGWESTEKTRGVYDFSAYERLLTALDAHRMRAVLILDYSHRLYEKERSVATAEGRAAYAKWAAAAVARFAGRGVVWEIWNEPNIAGFWKPEPNAADYAAMALAATKAMRAAAPTELIVGPATSTIDLRFIEACGKAGLFGQWDAVSVHPYRQEGPESVVGEYAKLRALINRYAPPGRKLPILSGEWGYSAAWKHFDPVRQGKMLPRQWLVNVSQGIPISIWYDWHDDGVDATEPEHHFGTVENAYHAGTTPVYTPKPAYLAAKTLTTTLAGSHFVKRLALGDPDNHALLFENLHGWVLAMWTTAQTPREVRIPSDAGTWQTVGHTGEVLPPVAAANGSMAVSLRDAPQYLTGLAANHLLRQVPAELPVKVTVLPALGGIIEVRVENLGPAAFAGSATLTELSGFEAAPAKLPFSAAGDSVESALAFTLRGPVAETYQAGVAIEAGGRSLLRQQARHFAGVPAAAFTTSRVWADGDAKVASRQTFEPADVPLDPPRSGKPAMMKLTYQMEAGWKFVQVSPQANAAAAIPGKPTAFGCWILSPGASGMIPRMRLKDATGQVWQASGEAIEWTGWRYVEFPLEAARCGHWGGADDGVVHYPLSWESYILLDNVKRTKTAGSVVLTAPVGIE